MWREVKFVDVGSRNGFTGFASDPWPDRDPLEDVGKNAEGVLSTNCCDVGGCAMERFRAGDTPELLACGMFPADGFSPQVGRALGLHSVSELATREPEPDLASLRSAVAPARALFSACVSVVPKYFPAALGGIPRGRELSLTAEMNEYEPMGAAFHMLFPQGDEWDERSGSVPFSEMPLV